MTTSGCILEILLACYLITSAVVRLENSDFHLRMNQKQFVRQASPGPAQSALRSGLRRDPREERRKGKGSEWGEKANPQSILKSWIRRCLGCCNLLGV